MVERVLTMWLRVHRNLPRHSGGDDFTFSEYSSTAQKLGINKMVCFCPHRQDGKGWNSTDYPLVYHFFSLLPSPTAAPSSLRFFAPVSAFWSLASHSASSALEETLSHMMSFSSSSSLYCTSNQYSAHGPPKKASSSVFHPCTPPSALLSASVRAPLSFSCMRALFRFTPMNTISLLLSPNCLFQFPCSTRASWCLRHLHPICPHRWRLKRDRCRTMVKCLPDGRIDKGNAWAWPTRHGPCYAQRPGTLLTQCFQPWNCRRRPAVTSFDALANICLDDSSADP